MMMTFSMISPDHIDHHDNHDDDNDDQVVAGTMYEFDLVLDHAEDSAAE